jgi:hypothetical protein
MYEWLEDSVKESRYVFDSFSLDWIFQFNEPASESEIEEYELQTGLSLPHSYKLFLLKHNGAHLFCSEAANPIFSGSSSLWANSGILIFEMSATREYKKQIHRIYDVSEQLLPLPIAYLGRIGTGDFCSLDFGSFNGIENPVLDCNHEYSPEEWKDSVIANSFEEWLRKIFERIIRHKSLPEYWFEDTLYDNSLDSV